MIIEAVYGFDRNGKRVWEMQSLGEGCKSHRPRQERGRAKKRGQTLPLVPTSGGREGGTDDEQGAWALCLEYLDH